MKIVSACQIFYKLAATSKKRGIACIQADHEKNNSNIDRFPINKLSEAKKAIQRINLMTKAPNWWDGTFDELKNIIINKVKEKFKVETVEGKTVVTLK